MAARAAVGGVGITLKAFANFQPRVALWQPWVKASHVSKEQL
jgi:hypothetical protein